jgi:hypothetical protein
MKADWLAAHFDEVWLRANFLPDRFRIETLGMQLYSLYASKEARGA